MNNGMGIVGFVIAGVVAAIVVFYNFPLNGDAVEPEKQEVVLEGFSGSKKDVVATHKEFTGAQKAIVVSPKKQEVVKEGFSKKYEVNGSTTAVPTPVPGKMPTKSAMATPYLVPHTKMENFISDLQKVIDQYK